jgi:hypothetical protein
MLALSRPLDAPARVPVVPPTLVYAPTGVHTFGIVFAQRQQMRLSARGMTNATANGTTSNDGSEEFDWIDDDN